MLNKVGKEWVHKETYYPDVIISTISVLSTSLMLYFVQRLVIFKL